MIIFPAIDLKGGKVVRLKQGRFEDVTQYSTDPVTIARQWQSQGAQWLHVVDLDGAQTGEMLNQDIVKQIAQVVKIPIQVGGGIRDEAVIEELLNAGIGRVILGTRVVQDGEFLKRVLNRWPEKIVVSLDCSKGFVAQRGWTTTTDLKAVDFAKELERSGLSTLIYTDIARDGMLQGPNFEEIQEILKAVTMQIIASGGVSNLEDIKKLYELQPQGLVGAITGKAIYEGKLDFKEAQRLCSTNA